MTISREISVEGIGGGGGPILKGTGENIAYLEIHFLVHRLLLNNTRTIKIQLKKKKLYH